MSQAKSHVQVTIGGKIDPSFQQAFNAADKSQSKFAEKSSQLGKTIGNIEAFRKQKKAVIEAKAAWDQATQQVAQLKREIDKSGTATRKQEADLRRAIRAAGEAANAFEQQRNKLNNLRKELHAAGVDTKNLAAESRRVREEYQRQEASLARQQKMVATINSAWAGVRKSIEFAGKAFATGGAAWAVLQNPVKKALSYEEQLARMANTAGSGQSVAERQRIQDRLSNKIDEARLSSGGSTREDVATTLKALIGSGVFDNGEAEAVLKDVSRFGFVSGSSAEDAANVAIALRRFGFSNLGPQLDKILKSADVGGFEVKNMAESLPSQLALARAVGYRGESGLTSLLALNQVAMSTAGNQSEAGNNVVNLLQKFSSREFSDSIAKNIDYQKGDPFREKKGRGGKTSKEFDWAGYLMSRKESGGDPVIAYTELLDRMLKKDKRYQSIRKRIDENSRGGKANPDDLAAMADIAVGSNIGMTIADRQALMGALAALYQQEDLNKKKIAIGGAKNVAQSSVDFLGSQNFAKSKILGGNIDRANEISYNNSEGVFAKFLDGLNGISKNYPEATSAVYGLSVSAGAAAAAIGAMEAAAWIFSGGKAFSSGAKGAAAGGASSVASSGAMGALGAASRILGPAVAAVSIANLTTPDEDKIIAENIRKEKEKMASLRERYGQDTLNRAYDKFAPWYLPGGVDRQQPARVEQWVQQLLAGADKRRQELKQPAMTFHNSYSVTVQQPSAPGSLEFAQTLERTMREVQRKAEADARSSMFNSSRY